MNVVDSSGWLEYLAGEENADFFAEAIQNTDELVVPAISLYEVFKRFLQQRNENDALAVAAQMSRGRVIELDQKIAMNAARVSHKEKLPMADSIILATARMFDATLWTQDEHFKDLENVRYIEKKRKEK